VDAAKTLLVGDSPVDLHTARAASTSVCVVRYGFGIAGFQPSELESADYVVDSPRDLLAIAR
jgi:phosphoglycolate phosphatase-like HAD superfamily hydrolase